MTSCTASIEYLASITSAEAATEEEFRDRLSHYADHFLLLFDGAGHGREVRRAD